MSTSVTKAPFGTTDGTDVDIYTLTNANGLCMKVMTYGAIVTNLSVPDRRGLLDDIVLGFDDLGGYIKGSPYFGATVGRVGNRIRNATFAIGNQIHNLAANDGPHHLHGGVKGWDKVVWQAEPLAPDDLADGPSIKLTHVSRDGEEGYPGAVTAGAIYTLTNKNELRIEMSAASATANRTTTIVNMVHHTYWNLGGARTASTIRDHELVLHAEKYTPGDPMVPTGEEKSVRGTAFDFTGGKPIGKDLEGAGGQPVGYDHNFIVDGDPNQLRKVARLRDPKSGRIMTLTADQPGVQFYSGNFLDGSTVGKRGIAYAQYTGLCLETQKFPNAINVPAWMTQVVLKPGQTYKHTMIHKFTAE